LNKNLSPTNTVVIELDGNVLTVSNNGEPFTIEGVESLMLPNYTAKASREYTNKYLSATINEQVNEFLEKRKALYRDHPEFIQQHYNLERETIGVYHGREVLELMQNCVDAMPGDGTIQIGAKGLGFRSLLNWCNRIRIYSGDLSICFGREEALSFGKSLSLNQKVATLSAPMIIVPIKLDYTTTIELVLNDSVLNDVLQQLGQIDAKSMVFLPKIEELIIRENQKERRYIRKEDCDGNVRITSWENNSEIEYFWRVFRQGLKSISLEEVDGNEKEYTYDISIAYCADLHTIKDNCLYSYFKTKVEIPIGWLCHADFELSSDRNSLNDHPLNTQILQEMVELIDVSSEAIVDEDNPLAALKSIIPVKEFSRNLSIGFDFSSYYYQLIGHGKILPTVNGDFVSIYDGPFILPGNLPSVFTGGNFSKLLDLPIEGNLADFVAKIALRDDISLNISEKYMRELINNRSGDWTIQECLVVLEWWRKDFLKKSSTSTLLPKLIKLENGEWAQLGKKLYFKTGRSLEVPEWVEFDFVSSNYKKAAIDFYDNDADFIKWKEQQVISEDMRNRNERLITRYVTISEKQVFSYLDRNSVISQVNSSVRDIWTRSREFVLWLFNNFGKDRKWSPPEDVSYQFPAYDKKTVTKPESLYLGKYYGNRLTEILAKQEDLHELHHFQLNGERKEDFVAFIAKFGVNTLPYKKQVSFSRRSGPVASEGYKKALIEGFPYPLQLDSGTVFPDTAAFIREGSLGEINVYSYQNLPNILAEVSTSAILLWIDKDEFLRDSLKSKAEKSPSSNVEAVRNQQRNWRYIEHTEMRNFLAYEFSTSKWIQIEEGRYSPQQIILDERIGNSLTPLLRGVSREAIFGDLELEDYEQNAIIKNLGFASDFSKIEPTVLYAILNELSKSEVDVNGEVSKRIYSQIIGATGLKKPDTTDANRVSFLKSGQVFCYDNIFHPVSEVFYADKIIPKEIKAQYHLLNLYRNQGAKKVELWFGVKELKPNLIVKDFEDSMYDQQFQTFFKELLKGLYVENSKHITDEQRWRALKNMKVTLVKSGTLEVENTCTISLSDYQYGQDASGRYLIKIENRLPYPYNERFSSALYEIVKTVISREDPTLGGSFRELINYPIEKLRNTLTERHNDPNIWQEADVFFDGTSVASTRDFTSENIEMFERCKSDYLDRFKRILYAEFKYGNRDLQRKYLSTICQYELISLDRSIPTLQEENCDVFSLLKTIAPATLLQNDAVEIDIESIGKETKAKLLEVYPENQKQLNLFLKDEYDSLMRFGNFDFIKEAFEEYLDTLKPFAPNTQASLVTAAEITPIIVDASNHQLKSLPSLSWSAKNSMIHRRSSSYIDHEARNRRNSAKGYKSEQIVFDYLKSKCGKDHVKWVSQFAKDANENLDGSDHHGYDIEYCVDAGSKHFVEVKTNSDALPDIGFYLTSAEKAIASNKENYQIAVVSNPDSDTPDIRFYSWSQVRPHVKDATEYLIRFSSASS